MVRHFADYDGFDHNVKLPKLQNHVDQPTGSSSIGQIPSEVGSSNLSTCVRVLFSLYLLGFFSWVGHIVIVNFVLNLSTCVWEFDVIHICTLSHSVNIEKKSSAERRCTQFENQVVIFLRCFLRVLCLIS